MTSRCFSPATKAEMESILFPKFLNECWTTVQYKDYTYLKKIIYFYKRIWNKTIEYKGNKFIDFCGLNSYSLKGTIKMSSRNAEIHWSGRRDTLDIALQKKHHKGMKDTFRKWENMTKRACWSLLFFQSHPIPTMMAVNFAQFISASI